MNINEASLPKVWQHIADKRAFAILTGFRSKYTYDENMRRNRYIVATLRNAGYGIFFIDGAWLENAGTTDEISIRESCIVTVGDGQKFKQLVIELGKRFEQDAVLISGEGGNLLYDQKGNPILDVGEIKLGDMGRIISLIRGEHEGMTFVFEGEREDLGWLARLTMQKSGTKPPL
jgi:hypothetical protein